MEAISLEAPERNMKWILIASIVMLFGSLYFLYYPNVVLYSTIRDAWYNMRIITTSFQILTVGASGLYIVSFVRRYTYASAILFFTVSIVLLFIQSLRGLF